MNILRINAANFAPKQNQQKLTVQNKTNNPMCFGRYQEFLPDVTCSCDLHKYSKEIVAKSKEVLALVSNYISRIGDMNSSSNNIIDLQDGRNLVMSQGKGFNTKLLTILDKETQITKESFWVEKDGSLSMYYKYNEDKPTECDFSMFYRNGKLSDFIKGSYSYQRSAGFDEEGNIVATFR